MTEILITPSELRRFMSEENYTKFINTLRAKLKNKGPIWIIAQVSEEKIVSK